MDSKLMSLMGLADRSLEDIEYKVQELQRNITAMQAPDAEQVRLISPEGTTLPALFVLTCTNTMCVQTSVTKAVQTLPM